MKLERFRLSFILLALLFCSNWVAAQMVWHNPLNENTNIVQGIALPAEVGKNFQRLAFSRKDDLRPEVWALSQNTAGLYIEFKTNAQKIAVRYTTAGMRAMPHMPSTGVSGLDLYVSNGKSWSWSPGVYSFKDTVSYTFDHIPPQKGIYRLYLPLYCDVKWLEIGTDTQDVFEFVSPSAAESIVIYGTSIAQGGCASRPGLAWPAILGRNLNQPIINLGFSGNGRLEKPIIDVMAQVKAKFYILDCMPNLGSKTLYPEEEIRKRLYSAVEALQLKNPNTPILLVEHSGGNENQLLDSGKNEGFRNSSAILNKLYVELKRMGKKNLYLLTTKEIGLTSNSTVDGAHPNDIGMMEHAIAFEKVYKKIFKEK